MNSVSSGDFQGQIYLNHVRDALWDQRASVLVGSGFSRNARKLRPESAPMPTWGELGRLLAASLAPQGTSRREASPDPSVEAADPVKLAQEYEDTFDRPALHRFLMRQVRDDDFAPGAAHRRLVELPWRDVFTTNWDTLLERSSREHHSDFSVLERPSGLPLVRPPRIVKLHGSFPHCDPLVATEEDYRTYPDRDRFAPFVNLARQAMMETTFLLLGFSGDDPNFKQWSGWVQDNLSETAPRTYLAGWLELGESQRQSLLRRNIVPIDLKLHPSAGSWPECESKRHELATELILLSLERSPTYELQRWPEPKAAETRRPSSLQRTALPQSSGPRPEPWPDSSASEKGGRRQEIEKITAIWRHNRECYPDWLVLPCDAAPKMRALTDSWEKVIVEALPDLGDAAARLKVLRELVWRRETLLDPLLEDLETPLVQLFDEVDCHAKTIGGEERDALDWGAARAQWKTVAVYLVTSARQDSDRETFDLRRARLEPFLAGDHELRQRMHHEECLWALNRQDWKALQELLGQWELGDEDRGWRLRKAALLIELNETAEALRLIDEVIEAVQGWRDDEATMAEPSMEAWALWLKHLLVGDPFGPPYEKWREFAPYRCDLLGEIRHHEQAVAGPSKKTKPKPFELGAVPGKTISFSNVPGIRARAALRAIRFSEMAGVPPAALGQVQYGVGSTLLGAAADALRPYIPEWTAWLTARCAAGASDEGLARAFSRSGVAFLRPELVRDLAASQRALIERSLERIPPRGGGVEAAFWRARLGASMEILSRCVVRLNVDETKELLELARRLYEDERVTGDLGSWDALGNLLRRSWEALPDLLQAQHALSVLSLPIVGLDGFSVGRPVAKFLEPAWLLGQAPGRRLCPPPDRSAESEEQWQEVVDLVDRGLRVGGEARKRAMGRLAPLALWGRLTPAEERRMAASLWGSEWQERSELPKEPGVRPWVFVVMPQPRAGVALNRLRTSWSRPVDWGNQSLESLEEFLGKVGGTLGALQDHGIDIVLSEDEEAVLRAAVERWAVANLVPALPWATQEVDRRWKATRAVAKLLLRLRVSEAAASSLGRRVEELRHDEVPAYELVPGILNSDPEQVEALAWTLRLGLASTVSGQLVSAVHGLFLWLEATKNGDPALPPTPAAVLREIGVIVANRRWPALRRALEVSEWVFKDGTLEQREVLREPLLEGLGRLLEELVYEEDVDKHPFIKRPWVDHEELDVPLLRWRCARTARAMEAAGFGDESVVRRWLERAGEDPLPEMRFVTERREDLGERTKNLGERGKRFGGSSPD